MTLALVVSSFANPISREQAQQRALAFLQNKRGAKRLTPVTRGARLAPRHSQPAMGHDLYFVFDRGVEEGFVIVPADDQTPAVLGYCDTGHFDYNEIPDNMRSWLDDYAQQIAGLQLAGLSAAELPVAALQTHDPIDQLMDSKWNQGAPYNLLCPDYFIFGTSVTGCVATAMAQILYYHRDNLPHETLVALPAYTANKVHVTYGHLQVDGVEAGAPLDWDNMCPTYSGSDNRTNVQKMAVAQLMQYCGVGVHMDYSNSGSGAYSNDVPAALQSIFGIPTTCRLISRSDMSEEQFDKTVYAELAKGDPVYLSGSNGSGGHAFVADGYDGNLCYHINWGWGGSSDGFFMLAKLNPASQGIGGSDGGYSDGQAAVIGIHVDNWKDKVITFSDTRTRAAAVARWDTDGDNKLSYAEAAAVTDLGDAFKGANIKTFNELYFFTGINSIPADAFAGCTSLTAIRLPKQVTALDARAFQGCTALKTVTAFNALRSVGEEAFDGCTKLVDSQLPESITNLGARAFRGCTSMTTLELPSLLASLGDEAFAGCTALTAVSFPTVRPLSVSFGNNLFEGVDLSQVTLTVAQGIDAFFAATAPWNMFAGMNRQRSLAHGNFIPLTVDKTVYLYNVGQGLFLTRGEAYETQGIGGTQPMRFRLGQTSSMGENIYYLYSEDTGSNNHYFFRSTTDGQVGKGIHATFVDGANSRISSSKVGWWQVQAVADGVYTLQTPEDLSDYVEGKFLGLQADHASSYAKPTYGAYSDVAYDQNPANCQWMFVEYSEQAAAVDAAAAVLKHLLEMASTTPYNVQAEQAVYDNTESTLEELVEAQNCLRKKLGIMFFDEEELRNICLQYWDLDGDGEMTTYEIQGIPNIYDRFQSSSLVNFDCFQEFTGCTSLAYRAFYNCKKLQSIVLPDNISSIGEGAFQGCTSLTDIEIQPYLSSIEQSAFQGCTKLANFRIHCTDPAYITLGSNVFKNVNLANATLYVPMGTAALYSAAEVWKDFGQIREMRSVTQPPFSPFAINTPGYIFNKGTRKYLSRGEAYGTQAVVDQFGMLYQVRRSGTGPNAYHYFYSDQTGNENHNLFRTTKDSRVGSGVKACFVDGGSNRLTDKSAYWRLAYISDDENEVFFTLQVPSTFEDYVEGEFLGIDSKHKTDVGSPTSGLYWDITYVGHEENCQWAFVKQADVLAAQQFDEQVAQLRHYLDLAAKRSVDATAEQKVYDNLYASADEVHQAILSLCSKLGFITFDSDAAKLLCVYNWDSDCDGEISLAEAAAVTDIAEIFRSQNEIRSLEELQYFTALTEIPTNAFRSTLFSSLYLPENVTKVGDRAFTSCNKLKYLAIQNPSTTPIVASGSNLPTSVIVFVPKAAIAAYEADPFWGKYTIREFTGVPTVEADDLQRSYGKTNGKLTFTITGAPVNGEPEIACETDATTPVGSYPITLTAGTITNRGLVLKNGECTVEPATLTVTAKSYTRNVGEPNPDFEFTYSGWKNRETADVLLSAPTIECEATPESPAGEYEIRVGGAEAQNYVFEYVNGTLTVIDPVGVRDVKMKSSNDKSFDLSGRPITNMSDRRTISVSKGRKVIVKQ
jgi:hypothetical protein